MGQSFETQQLRRAAFDLYKAWVGLVAAVAIETDINPGLLVPARRGGSTEHTAAKALLCAGWTRMVGLQGIGGRGPEQGACLVWLEAQMDLSRPTLRRLTRAGASDPRLESTSSKAFRVAKCLSRDSVRVAIAAGWIGRERHAAAMPRSTRGLLKAAREWTREEAPDAALLP